MASKSQYDAPPALTANGWYFDRPCKCKYKKKYYYKHPDKPGIEVEWHISSFQFKVTTRGLTMRALTSLSKLDIVLKSL